MSIEQDYIWDDRAPSFRLLADGAQYLAQRSHVEIDTLTYNRWSDMGALIREIDTLYDDFNIPSEEIIERLNTYDEFRDIYPSLAPAILEEEKRQKLLATTRVLFHLGALAALATNPKEYAEIRLAEASTTANLVTDIATDDVMNQQTYSNEFVPAMQNFFVGVTFFDSFLDASIDYRQGKTNVEPSKEYYHHIRMMGRSGMRYTLLLLLRPTMPKLALTMAGKRIKTRLTHGMTNYSTMQNVPDFFNTVLKKRPEALPPIDKLKDYQ